ncbi:MAG TPA: hypothetical protein VE172_24890 [Stackebrandtia sp.]|uniref:hypothetical protein n=1 Tax=Stackebrandtia sp. TaxID=2023065 RepID=UPI002D5497D1|nr:hypothetical protein [Stackebrandtia sp.]HZE42046.1 hypothetical protein [Stackebrandtia sp.]
MVTSPHEALHRIFTKDHALVSRALTDLLGVDCFEPESMTVINADVTELEPIERRVDTVLMAETKGVRHIFAIESQSDVDRSKYESWPYYIAYLHAKFHCQVTLIVVTSKAATTRWARGPIEIGLDAHASMVVSPLVLGPENVPAITNAETARRDITLAVFSALTHRRDAGVTVILEALVTALSSTDPDTAGVLFDFVEAGLGDTLARKHWRDMILNVPPHMLQGTLATKLREEGREEATARNVLRLLEQRGIQISEETRQRVLSCTDLETLDRWFDRAVAATSAEDLFA